MRNLPLSARAFLDLGGRIMINPKGGLEVGGGMQWALPTSAPDLRRRSFITELRLCRRLRSRQYARLLKSVVKTTGYACNGWLVLQRDVGGQGVRLAA